MTRAFLLVALVATLSNVGWTQDAGADYDETSKSQAEKISNDIEETSELVVMVRDQLGSGPSFGAGIIFGRDHERLYIATANHVVRRGAQQASAITVSLLFAPEKSFPAKLLDHFDASLDIGVIAIEGWTKLHILGCDLPFHSSLSIPNFPDRTSAVFAIGNPNGDAWRAPSQDDLIHADRQELRFRSAFLGPGYSGGGLLDDRGMLEGMIVRDEAPIGYAVPIEIVLSLVASWGYPVELHNLLGEPTPLEAAARHGNIDKLTAALSVVCASPDEALFYAAESGQPEIVSTLLKAGINPNASMYKQTALHAAVEHHHPKTVKLLLAAGADLSAKNREGHTPLDLVNPEGASPKVAQAQLDIVNTLVDAGAKSGSDTSDDSAFRHALWAGNKDIAALLIRAGANVSQGDYRTPLEIAVEVGSKDLVELLLAAGASVDSKNLMHLAFLDRQDTHSGTPRPRSEAILVTLLRAGAPIDTSLYCDPLLEAVNLGWRDATRLLIERGANVNESNEKGYFSGHGDVRPLELAIEKNDMEMVKLLLASGAKVNVPDIEDPLHTAACHSGPPMLQLLINAGAQINRRNTNLETALHEAIGCQNADAEQFLRHHGGVK